MRKVLTAGAEWVHSPIDIYRRSAVGSSDNLLGALELLVLKALESGAMHGWGITLHIQSVSNEVLRVEEGSLYPALHRMEKAGWVKAEWGLSENNRRARFYKITAAGRNQLNALNRQKWENVAQAIALVLAQQGDCIGGRDGMHFALEIALENKDARLISTKSSSFTLRCASNGMWIGAWRAMRRDAMRGCGLEIRRCGENGCGRSTG